MATHWVVSIDSGCRIGGAMKDWGPQLAIGTQKSRLLDHLARAGDMGLCIIDIGAERPFDVLTARNRISELRSAGYQIRGTRCRIHRHKAAVERYYLVGNKSSEETE